MPAAAMVGGCHGLAEDMARSAVCNQLYHRTLWVSSDRTGAEVQLPNTMEHPSIP